jgi:glycosyltransferase involved in cell wall biosynthesis
MPFFSVVIPTYNRAHLIVPTLASILKQDFQDYEVLIIDDGSTDDTEDVVEIHFPTETKIHYIRKKNEERSIARNTGFQLADGEYVVFFDSDDIMLPHYLSTLEKAIEKYPDCNFFATKYQIETQGQIAFNEINDLKEGFYDYRLLLKGNVFGTMVCAKKKNPQFQYFSPQFNMCEDWIFNIFNLKKDTIYLIDNVAITIINHDTRSMANNQKAIAGRQKAMEFIKNNIPFDSSETRFLEGYTYQFCAIHAYIDADRKNAFHFWWKTTQMLGWNTHAFLLFLKILLGKKLINWLIALLPNRN